MSDSVASVLFVSNFPNFKDESSLQLVVMARLYLANNHMTISLWFILTVSAIIIFFLLDVCLEFQSTRTQHHFTYMSRSDALSRDYRHYKSSEGKNMAESAKLWTKSAITYRPRLSLLFRNNSNDLQEECRNGTKISSTSSTPRHSPFLQKKHFVFIGYREHWGNLPPFECKCPNQSILVEELDYSDDLSNTGKADCLLFVLAPKGRLHSREWQTLRKNRGQNQTWLFATRESASTTHPHMSPPEKYSSTTYHISFTYHSKSDLPTPYGKYLLKKSPEVKFKEKLTVILEKKEHLMSWMSSSCVKEWGRTEFVKHLSQMLPVHMYGTCGNMTCVKMAPECNRRLTSYKFALVLENSCCPEYITEKFWNAFTYEQVPVVLGAFPDEYARLAPPNSYILIEDFKTITELVKFIKKVDSNDSLYMKYHEWRRNGYIELAQLPADFISSCHSICRVASKIDKLRAIGDNAFHFDSSSSTWFGGCRNCDEIVDKLKNHSIPVMSRPIKEVTN